jgi:hypothetical protein
MQPSIPVGCGSRPSFLLDNSSQLAEVLKHNFIYVQMADVTWTIYSYISMRMCDQWNFCKQLIRPIIKNKVLPFPKVPSCTTFICGMNQNFSFWNPVYLKAHYLCVCACVRAYIYIYIYIYRMLRQECAILGSASITSIFIDETKISYIRSQNVNGENREGLSKEW